MPSTPIAKTKEKTHQTLPVYTGDRLKMILPEAKFPASVFPFKNTLEGINVRLKYGRSFIGQAILTKAIKKEIILFDTKYIL